MTHKAILTNAFSRERFKRIIDQAPDGYVAPEGECVLWHGFIQSNGYGQRWYLGRRALAHRVAAAEKYGPIPPGMHVDHLCRNRACVNPDHLEIVTPRENLRRGNSWKHNYARGLETHCQRGHEFTPENTITQAGVYRLCRACHNMRVSAYKKRKRAKGKLA